MKKIIIVSLSFLILFGFSLSVFAAVETLPTGTNSVTAIVTIIERLANWIFTILMAVAVIMLLLAAFNWLTSAGNEDKLSSARKMLIWALVGIAVALAARGLVAIIRALVTG